MPRPLKYDPTILEAALVGLEQKRQRLDEQIAQIRRILGTGIDGMLRAKGISVTHTHKRHLSAAARKRIAEAQKKRWEAYRKAKGTK